MIVMLTAETEGGQLKCHPYWKGKTFGPLTLQPLSERKAALADGTRDARRGSTSTSRSAAGKRRQTNPTPDHGAPPSPLPRPEQPHVVIRKFALSHTAHPFAPIREITQLQYSSWPDFGAPAHPAQVLSLVEHCNAVVRSHNSPVLATGGAPGQRRQRPVLVHCSAGCGRTGTFCTIDTVIDMLRQQRLEKETASQTGAEPMDIDLSDASSSSTVPAESTVAAAHGDWVHDGDLDLIAKTVEEFRDQRLSMVQSLRQFVLCYETVLEWLVTQQQRPDPTGRRSYSGGH